AQTATTNGRFGCDRR
ncbi:alcohol dehydrogenase GroES-like domain protein, partial [Vibrio parahaemolyticus V-223/04]